MFVVELNKLDLETTTRARGLSHSGCDWQELTANYEKTRVALVNLFIHSCT